MSISKPKKWQYRMAISGTLIWFVLLQSLQFLNHSDYLIVKSIVSGYIFGFLTAFSGFVFWDIMRGSWKKYFGNDRGIFLIITCFTLLVLFSLGLLGFVNGVLNSMPWYYVLSFSVASIIVNQCLMPVTNYLDQNKI